MQSTNLRASIYLCSGVLHRMSQLRPPLAFSLLVMKSPCRTPRQQNLMPALQPPVLLSVRVSSSLCCCPKVVTYEEHPQSMLCPSSACLPAVVRPCGCLKTCMSLMDALCLQAKQHSLSLPSPLCMNNTHAPAHADMPQRAESRAAGACAAAGSDLSRGAGA